MKLRLQLVFLFCLVACARVYAQPICGFDEQHQRLMATDAKFAERVKANEVELQQYIKAHPELKLPPSKRPGVLSTAIIPVVVHVIHTGGAVGSAYNPSKSDIEGAIAYLNKVYAADASVTDGSVSMPIQFVLAKRTPDCNATDGIVRVDASSLPNYVANGVNNSGSSGMSDLSVKNLSRWDPTKYYNIWVVNKIDGMDGTSGQFVAGYAYLASGSAGALWDGTVMLATQMRSGQKTLPHEIGHAFNLYHPFEGSPDKNTCPANTNCATDGDRVCDTDPISYNQIGGVIDFVPRTGNNPCTGTPYIANTESNYMNYTNSYKLFTLGQAERVNAAMGTLRSSLALSFGAIAPSAVPVCNSQINFENGSSAITEAAGTIDPANPCRTYKDYVYKLNSGLPPSQAVTATLTLGGTAVKGRDYDVTTNGDFVSPSMDIAFSTAGTESKTFTLRVYDDKSVAPQKTILIGFTLNNGGASVGDVYPTHTVSIMDNDLTPMPNSSGTITIGTPYYSQTDEASCFGGNNLTKHRVQYLIRSEYIYSSGLSGTAALSSLKFNINTKNSTTPFKGFTVSLAQVPASTTVLNNFVSTGFTQVYSGDYTTQLGANTIPFSTNFNWDGSSNIVINVCYDNAGAATSVDRMLFSPSLGAGQTVTIMSNGSFGGGSGCNLSVYYLHSIMPIVSFDYTISSGSPVESTSSSSQSEHLGPLAEVYFKNASGGLIASIKNLSNHDYGCTSIEIDRAGTGASQFWYTDNGNYLASKTFKVTPSNPNPNGLYEIKLYYTKAEIDGWMAATGKKLSDPDVAVVKVSNHQIKDVTPTSAFPADVVTAPLTKTTFGSDTVVIATLNSGFSGFGLGAPGATPLPVSILSFTGKKNNDYVVLNWVTATEINNDHFDVETSKDGIHFFKIGEVKGNGNSNVQQRYNYIHNAPVVGTNYYRLKQVDINGKSDYSKMLVVEFDKAAQTISIYPNPVSEELYIDFDKEQKNVVLKIVSIDGKIVATKTLNNAQGKASMNVSSLTSGLYVLEITMDNKEIKHFRFLKK